MSNVMKQLGGGGAGQSIRDRISAAKYTVSGEGLGRAVCKASTEQIAAPKKKHIDYLVLCTNEPNVSIPRMADLLIGRLQHHNWVTVFKALVSMHHIMNYGNERFMQYLASNNCTISLPNFYDKSTTQGYDMSVFVRRYSKYVHEKAVAYRAMAFDFCKIKRGKDDGMLRLMAIDRLLKAVPVLQAQVDVLLEFDAQATDLHNGVVNAAFILLFKDLIRLFACYNDAMINLLEKFFELQKKQCREALDIYKRFLIRMDKVGQFLRVAETVGIDKGEIPDLARAPASLLEALEMHLNNLEGSQPGTTSSSTIKWPSSNDKSGAFASGGTNNGAAATALSATATEEDKRRILEEEARRIQAFEKARSKTVSNTLASPPSAAVSADVVAASAQAPSTFDLFDPAPAPTLATNSGAQIQKSNATVDQLFSLEAPVVSVAANTSFANPFANLAGAQPVMPPVNPFLFTSPSSAAANAWSSSAFGPNCTKPTGFDSSFGNAPVPSSVGVYGNVLQPTNSSGPTKVNPATTPTSPTNAAKSFVAGDIDSSIASLAGNLTIAGGYKKQDWSGSAGTQQQKVPIALLASNQTASTPFASSQITIGSNPSANPFGTTWNNNSGSLLQPQPVASSQPNTSAILQNQLPQLYALRPAGPVPTGFPPAVAVAPMQYPVTALPIQQSGWVIAQPAGVQQPNDPFGAL